MKLTLKLPKGNDSNQKETGRTSSIVRVIPVSTGHMGRRLRDEESGRNKTAALLFTTSKKDPCYRKVWVDKKFYRNDEDPRQDYQLPNAISEVFAATLDVALRNKYVAPKTKFNITSNGVMSRVIGDDFHYTLDLFRFLQHQKPLPQEACETLLYSLLFAIIIGDRDIRLENLIIKCTPGAIPIVYGIDHEYAFKTFPEPKVSLAELLRFIAVDPKRIMHIILNGKFTWNRAPHTDERITESDINAYAKLLLGFSTPDMLIRKLHAIVTAIAANNFSACELAKNKVMQRVITLQDLCTIEQQDQISKQLDEAILALQGNVGITAEFLKEMQPINKPCLRMQ